MQKHEPHPEQEAVNQKMATVVVSQKQSASKGLADQWHLPCEQVSFGVACVDGQGTIQQVNTLFCHLLGYKSTDLRSRKLIDLISPDDREEDLQYLRALVHGADDVSSREERYIRQDKSLLWVLVNKTPIFVPGQNARSCLVTLQDISMRKEHEEYLRKLLQEMQTRNSQLEAIFESINDNVFAYGTDERPFRINSASMHYVPDLTLDEEYYSHTLQERLMPLQMRYENGEAIPYEEWPMKRALRGEIFKGDSAVDVLFKDQNGQDIQVSLSGAPIMDQEGRIVGSVCISRDVTERRRLERQTHEAMDALVAMAQTLVEAPAKDRAAEPAMASNQVRQRIVELTRSVLRSKRVGILAFETDLPEIYSVATVGFSQEQEQTWFSAVPGEQSRLLDLLVDPAVYTRLQQHETVQLDIAQANLEHITPFQGVCEVLAAPIHINGQLVGALYADHGMDSHTYRAEELALIEAMARLCALSIERERGERERTRLLTALQTSNEQLAQSNTQLAQVNKLQSDFISIVSHEFRTTLTGIQGFSELLRDEEFNTSEVRDFATDIHTDALRLTRMISELLDLERMKLGKMTLHLGFVDFNAILEDVAERTRPTASQHHVLMQLEEHLPRVEGDYDKLIQVVTNLVSNAVKYSPNGGDIVLSSKLEGELIHVSIADQGVGIPPEALEDVFVPYNRLESGKTHYIQGTGLGLAIVREIIQMHAGNVWVESMLGEGSTFHFTLPLIHTPTA
ncbi:MAG TPA: ATP-binding protein [Ktedonobacteraceae bacterium]|nr:ATP-binding protein [Ktedonobacteraceae bacterium]